MNFEDIRERVKSDISCMKYLSKAKKSGIICPYPDCQSGSGPNGTGAVVYYPETNTFYCHKCQRGGDSIDAYLLSSGRNPDDGDDHRAAVLELGESIGLYEDDRAPKTGRKAAETGGTVNNTAAAASAVEMQSETPKKANTPGKYAADCMEWAANIEKTDYLTKQGIPLNIQKAFHVGYIPEQNQVVFPYSADFSYWQKRPADKADKRYMKPRSDDAGPEPLYNPGALYTGEPCFVCEGAVDVMSFAAAGVRAVGVMGAGVTTLKDKCKSHRPPAPLILWYDNDLLDPKTGKRAGQAEQKKCADELTAAGIPFIEAEYDPARYGLDHGDPNDFLQADPEQFERDIQSNLERGRKLKELGPDMAVLFKEIYSERYRPLKTGIEQLDKFLDGGLIRQTLVLLGARPGAGKTILATQIAESLAKEGHQVFYICLEMSKSQLLARSLSRIMYTDPSINYTTNSVKILQGYKHDDEMKEAVTAAAKIYAADIGPNIIYNPFNTPDIDELINRLQAAGDAAKEKGRPGPIVFIDYLHLLTSKQREEQTEIIKRAVTALKQYAVDYNTIVVAIEAQNRQANDAQKAVLSGGRDSSNLEYSGDLILSLVTGKQEDPVKGDPNSVKLYVIKSRFTAFDIDDPLEFVRHGGQSYFAQVGEWTSAAGEKVPFTEKTTVDPDGTVKVSV